MVKFILLSDEVYEKLNALRRGRSFSEVILELIHERNRSIQRIKIR